MQEIVNLEGVRVRFFVSFCAFVFIVSIGAGPAFSENLTLGLVQSKIKVGMTQGEVAGAIGSPNIASRNRDGVDVWIYDKISSETETETEADSKGKSSGFAVGGGGLLGLGGILGGFGSSQGSSSSKAKTKVETTKKTLTVVVKFDKNSLVKETNYHMSKF